MGKSTLKDRIAVITGATGSIGGAIAERLAREGASVCLVGRNALKLEAAALSCKQHAATAWTYACDLGRDEDLGRIVKAVLADAGPIDILVHGAGILCRGSIEHAPMDEYDLQVRINARAPLVLTKAFLPALKKTRGQVVFINSSVVQRDHAGLGHYVASKKALQGIADSLRAEVNADGVRVISVYPGRTAGEMQKAVHRGEQKAYVPERLVQPEDVAAVVADAISLPRTAEVTDVFLRPMQKPS